jgi:hypothetical protein
VKALAYDSGYGSYHLTPRGWVKGGKPPPDRAETWDYDMHQASGWSKEVFNFEQIWVSEVVTKADRDAMWKKFGPPLSSDRSREVNLKR